MDIRIDGHCFGCDRTTVGFIETRFYKLLRLSVINNSMLVTCSVLPNKNLLLTRLLLSYLYLCCFGFSPGNIFWLRSLLFRLGLRFLSIEVPPVDRQHLFILKLRYCISTFPDFSDSEADLEEKERKKAALEDIINYIALNQNVLFPDVYPLVFRLVSTTYVLAIEEW